MKDEWFIIDTLSQRGRYCSIDPIIGGSLIVGGSALASSLMGGNSAKKAAGQQAAAIREATAEQRRQYNETVGRMQPYTKFGGEQLNALSGWLQDPSKQPMNYLDPGYEFRREQGMRGLTGNAATAGLLQSGDTLRGIQNYGQGLASSEYGNAFNRWLGEGQYRQGLAGMGQNAAANLGYIGQNSANSISNLLSQGGSAEAAGTLGQGKAWADFASGAGGFVGNNLSRYIGQNRTTAPSGSNIFNSQPSDKVWIDPNYMNA